MEVCVWDSGSVCRGWWRCVEGMVEVFVGNSVGVGMVGCVEEMVEMSMG